MAGRNCKCSRWKLLRKFRQPEAAGYGQLSHNDSPEAVEASQRIPRPRREPVRGVNNCVNDRVSLALNLSRPPCRCTRVRSLGCLQAKTLRPALTAARGTARSAAAQRSSSAAPCWPHSAPAVLRGFGRCSLLPARPVAAYGTSVQRPATCATHRLQRSAAGPGARHAPHRASR